MKLLVISSVGGHLTEVMLVVEYASGKGGVKTVLVVNDRCALPEFPFARVYRIAHAERDWRVLVNLHECARILYAERPDVVMSTGAGPAVPMFLLAAMMGIRTVFVETAAAVVRPSLTGRLVRRMADRFFVQWPGLAAKVPGSTCARVVFP